MSTPAFQFKDLDDKAKERAREKMSEWQVDHSWWEHIYDDAVHAMATISIEVGEKANRTAAGQIIKDPSIWFSGFGSQGDGCSFEGVLYVARLKECTVKAKAYAPLDTDFHALALRAEGIFDTIIVEQVRQRMLSVEDHPDCHEAATFLISSGPRGHTTELNYGSGIPIELEKTIDSWLKDVAAWIYDLLEKEYDHLISEESLNAACEGYTFDEGGEIQ